MFAIFLQAAGAVVGTGLALFGFRLAEEGRPFLIKWSGGCVVLRMDRCVGDSTGGHW